jgi:hypothetical protein
MRKELVSLNTLFEIRGEKEKQKNQYLDNASPSKQAADFEEEEYLSKNAGKCQESWYRTCKQGIDTITTI